MTERRVAIVTGAAGGIGAVLVERMRAKGYEVLATDLRPAEGIEAHDVRDAASWDAVMEHARARWGRLDVLVNGAGFLEPGWLHEASAEAVGRHMDVNAKGVLLGMRAAARWMVAQGGGHIVNVASLAALAPIPGLGLYSASKYAVRAASICAAMELKRHGVFVTVVCPDAVRTPMLELQVERAEAALTFSGPRILEPEEVADAILAALARRPLEVWLPAHRGWLARFSDLFPALGSAVAPLLEQVGRRRQRQVRG